MSPFHKYSANDQQVTTVRTGRASDQAGALYLHVHQGAVLSGPGLLQDLKDGHRAAVHDVHLTAADGQAGQFEVSRQQLLL